MIDAALIEACAPAVAVETIQAIVRVESGGDPLALASNRPSGAKRLRASSITEAIAITMREIRAGNSVDIGLMQINSRNLARLNLSVETVLEPCANIAAGAAILTESYDRAVKFHGDGQPALHAALSAYNTGNLQRGFQNGYVAKYTTAQPPPQRRPTAPSNAVVYAADFVVYRRNPQENTP